MRNDVISGEACSLSTSQSSHSLLSEHIRPNNHFTFRVHELSTITGILELWTSTYGTASTNVKGERVRSTRACAP